MSKYIGRFAPSPTGQLHAGSLACMVASYVDAKAHNGTWFIRVEDIDPPREPEGVAEEQLKTIEAFGLRSDLPILWQQTRYGAYQESLEFLKEHGFAYGCSCSRKSIELASEAAGLLKGVYPGTCREGTHGLPIRAWRFRVNNRPVSFVDRWQGLFSQNVEKSVGDFVLKRADGFWAYQLAVVVDDAYAGVTHIVRGADLLDNSPRQLLLQKALGVPHPEYMHIPLVLNEEGQKLSKQSKAQPIDMQRPEEELAKVWKHLGFEPFSFDTVPEFFKKATALWKERFNISAS